MAEATAGPAFSVVGPALQDLATAHDVFLRSVCGDDTEATDPVEILNAYDAAVRDLLPFLPAGSLQHECHDVGDPVYMAADLVLVANAPAVEPTDGYRELAKWAAKKLRRNQRRTVELLAENAGSLPIADVASDEAIRWQAPYDDAVTSLIRELNREGKLPATGWRIYRHDNEIRLEKINAE